MTVTSNIYTNLAGWSNATYAIGQERVNVGNAYVCSTPGTSTAPPTGTGVNIAPGGTAKWDYISAVDFTTLQGWIDSIPSTLTQPYIGNWDDGGGLLTYAYGSGFPLAWFSGHTTTTTNTITLQPRSGRGFQSKYLAAPTTQYAYSASNGLAISTPTSGTTALGINLIQVDDANVNLLGLQLKDGNSTSNMSLIGGSGANLRVVQCILDGITQGGGASIIGMSGTGFYMANSLVVDRVTSLTSATLKATAAGAVLVNNTIICANNVSSMSAVDAGANTSAASSFAINNIFVGYGTNVFIASSGFVWSTHNNAYTNAAFGTNGTDSGGSAYNITPSAVFVSSTTDFHIKTGSAASNSGSTDTSDLPAANDFAGTSRPQGANWDMGAHELLVGSTILRDFVASLDTKTTRVADRVLAIEWKIGRILPTNDAQIAIEWRRSLLSDRIFAQEELASWPMTIVISGFSGGFSGGFGGPFSSPWSSRPDLISPVEWSNNQANLTANSRISVEWGRVSRRDIVTPDDWRGGVLLSEPVPIDWLAATTVDKVSHMDLGKQVTRDAATSVDFSLQTTITTLVNTEWRGFAGVFMDGGVPLEFSTVRRQSSTIPMDFSTPVVVSNSNFPVDFSTSQQYSTEFVVELLSTKFTFSTQQMDWTGPVGSVANMAVPLEWGISVRVSITPSTESRASILLDTPSQVVTLLSIVRDSPISTTSDAGRVLDATAPLDYGLALGGGFIYPIVIDWRKSIQEDLVSGASTVGNIQSTYPAASESLASTSPVIGAVVEWKVGVVLDTPVRSEWGHLLITRNVDGAFAMDHLSIVTSSITLLVERKLGRKSHGGHLEPDEWEFTHEPKE